MPSTPVASSADNELHGITLFDALPQRASRNSARVNDVDLGYSLIEPDGPSRGTAVLVAGYTSSYDTFNVMLAPLAENGFRVIGLSERGQPHSSGPDEVEGYSLEQLGRDIHGFLDVLGIEEPVHLLGHSFGGVVAQEAVIQNPARFATVTFWNSGPRAFDDGAVAYDALLKDGPRGLWVIDRTRLGQDPDADIAGTMNVIEEYYFSRLMTTKPAQLIAGAAILRDQVDRTRELAATGVPFLVSHGAQDDAWPVDWQRDMALALGADYVVLANAGHSSHGDRPNMAADVLATFWSDRTTSTS
jgi:pimeloyl-ACP methyl ester carboxylesterase